ncbi:MAG: hypothetical protein GY810_06990 [Aureispira sp.]|nr:hypothetical protein [Aureispira sp.]
MNSTWSRISLFFFLTIAILGSLIRAFPFANIPVQYRHIVHAHSHVAFQGWIYTLMLLFLTNLFLSKEQIKSRKYPLQFKLTIPIILGILIAFMLQGYAFYSILFSTIFQLLNYWFIFSFFRDTKHLKNTNNISIRFVRAGLWLGLFSTLAPWAIGILSAKGFANTEPYHSAIYFFLHFQYNGWFLFVAIGLLFKCLEQAQIDYDNQKAKYFFLLFTTAVIPAYALSLLGMSYSNYVIIPAVIAAILQLGALVFFVQLMQAVHNQWLAKKSLWIKLFLYTSFASFIVKIGLQFLSIFPALELYAFGSRYLIMAYIHLSLIGVISFFFIGLLLDLNWIKIGRLSKIGSALLLIGFALSELILVVIGFGLSMLPKLLLIFSILMAIGILLLLLSPSNTSKS